MDAPKSRRLYDNGPLIEFIRHEKYSGWTLVIDGFYHSNLDLDGEPKLNFDYAKRIAVLTDTFFTPTEPISVLHLGGGALSIPRYIEETRKGSAQLVVEIDEEVIKFVEEYFPLPEKTNIQVVYADASNPKKAISDYPIQMFDLIICDVYLGNIANDEAETAELFTSFKDMLLSDGVLIINAVDDLATQVEFASKHFLIAKNVFEEAALIADIQDLAEGRKTNILIAAGRAKKISTLSRIEARGFGETAVARTSEALLELINISERE